MYSHGNEFRIVLKKEKEKNQNVKRKFFQHC